MNARDSMRGSRPGALNKQTGPKWKRTRQTGRAAPRSECVYTRATAVLLERVDGARGEARRGDCNRARYARLPERKDHRRIQRERERERKGGDVADSREGVLSPHSVEENARHPARKRTNEGDAVEKDTVCVRPLRLAQRLERA